MTMLLNFVTALAWIWGGSMAVVVFVQLLPPPVPPERVFKNFLCGIPAWAAEWAERFGVDAVKFRRRINRGWSFERAVCA